jgi:hypothetical protein
MLYYIHIMQQLSYDIIDMILLSVADIYITSRLFRYFISRKLYTIPHTINWRSQYGIHKINKLERWNHYQVLKYLYHIGAESPYTLLDFAIEYNNLRMVKYFCNIVDHVAIDYMYVDHMIPIYTIDYVVQYNKFWIMVYLHSIGLEANNNTLLVACINGNLEMTQYIHKYMGIFPNENALDYAEISGNKKLCKYIRRILNKLK